MTKLAWDKSGERLFESGVDHAVLYLPGVPGIPWNGIVSIEESVSGGETEAYHYDGVKYFDSVANEDFKATLTAFTYPQEFEVCLGTIQLVPGLRAAYQIRKSFGLVWRTKIGNDIDGLDHGYRLHMLWGATAAPATRSDQTLSDSSSPINFSWEINTVPVMPGADLNVNSDPSDWVWPEGYAMAGWPMGPDGNTPVRGWKATSYVMVESTSLDALALTDLEDRLFGTLTTPAYLPSQFDTMGIANGEDVDYNIPDGWSDPNRPYPPIAATDPSTRIYWSNDTMLFGFDLTSRKLGLITQENALIPEGFEDNNIGSPILLGNGNLLIAVRTGDLQEAFVVTPDLIPTGEVWKNQYNQLDWNTGYVGYEEASGVYDPKTKLNWHARTVIDGGHAWVYNGFDDGGNFVSGRADAQLIPVFGDAYYGGGGLHIAVSMLGRWLYSSLPNQDGVQRYNLDTDVWEAIAPQYNENHDYGYSCQYVGVDPEEGTVITVNTTWPGQSTYDGKGGWIQIRDPEADPWTNPVPNGLGEGFNMGPPLREYDPSVPGMTGNAFAGVAPGPGNNVAIRDGKLYYVVKGEWGDHTFGYGYDDDVPYGVFGVYAMTLSNGEIEKIFEFPYEHYDAAGVINHSNWDYSSEPNNGLMGALFVDVPGREASTLIKVEPHMGWGFTGGEFSWPSWNLPYPSLNDSSTDAYPTSEGATLALVDSSDRTYVTVGTSLGYAPTADAFPPDNATQWQEFLSGWSSMPAEDDATFEQTEWHDYHYELNLEFLPPTPKSKAMKFGIRCAFEQSGPITGGSFEPYLKIFQLPGWTDIDEDNKIVITDDMCDGVFRNYIFERQPEPANAPGAVVGDAPEYEELASGSVQIGGFWVQDTFAPEWWMKMKISKVWMEF